MFGLLRDFFSISFLLIRVMASASTIVGTWVCFRTVDRTFRAYSSNPKPGPITNAVALSEWKKFNATADKLLRITATNLKSLSVVAKKTPMTAEKESLLLVYHQSEKDYKALKARLALQNKMFQEDIDSNILKSEEDYGVFKDLFTNDILELNNNLEDILEELQSVPVPAN